MERSKEYLTLVTKGKNLIDKLNELKELEKCYQAKIAKYAITVCDICHGGISKNKYTLKDYALDVGVFPKTLQNWVSIYRNVIDKLNIEEPTIDEWKKANKVNRMLKVERMIDNQNDGKPKSKSAFKRGVPEKKVRKIFDEIDFKPFVLECNSILSSAKHAKHILTMRDLNIVEDSKLLHLMEILDDASDLINNHLTAKRKGRVA